MILSQPVLSRSVALWRGSSGGTNFTDRIFSDADDVSLTIDNIDSELFDRAEKGVTRRG